MSGYRRVEQPMRTAAAVALLVAALVAPTGAHAQVELMAGVMVADANAPPGGRVAPLISTTVGTSALGFPLLLEAGFARSDFISFGEAFHRNQGVFALVTEWMPVREAVDGGLRLGIGAVVEDDISEDDSAFRSSNNWASAVVVGLVLRRQVASDRALVLAVSDHLMYAWDALIDPDESSVEHRLRLLVGLRF